MRAVGEEVGERNIFCSGLTIGSGARHPLFFLCNDNIPLRRYTLLSKQSVPVSREKDKHRSGIDNNKKQENSHG